MIRRLGIFGGTFNPVHIAHLVFAKAFYNQCNLDRLFWVPAHISPFKQEEEMTVPYVQRLHMLKEVIKNHNDYYIDQFELQQGGVSYSINTINHFTEMFPNSEIYLMIGLDQAADFKKWKNWEEILSLVHLRIFNRLCEDCDVEAILDELNEYGKDVQQIEAPILDISSTLIRRMIKRHESIKYLVPPEVEEYIMNNKLYQ